MGISQAGVLCLNVLQNCLPDVQPREIEAAQVTAQPPHDIDQAAGCIAMRLERLTPQSVQQPRQTLLGDASSRLTQTVNHRLDNQALLTTAHEILCLRNHNGLPHQYIGSTVLDLLG